MPELLWQMAEEAKRSWGGSREQLWIFLVKPEDLEKAQKGTTFTKGINHSLTLGAPSSLRSSAVALFGRPGLVGGSVAVVMGPSPPLGWWSDRSQLVDLLWWDLLCKWGAITKCAPGAVFLELLEWEEFLAYSLLLVQLDYHSPVPPGWAPRVSLVASWPKMWDT